MEYRHHENADDGCDGAGGAGITNEEITLKES